LPRVMRPKFTATTSLRALVDLRLLLRPMHRSFALGPIVGWRV
jgi:hypothetical protein